MVDDDWTQANDRRMPRAGRPSLGIAYWLLWTSSGLSNLADGVVKVVLPLVAIRFTDSPTLIAGLTFVLTLPWLLFALPAGALADRLDRRRAMLGANAVRAMLLVVLVLTVMVDDGSIWVLYVVALCIGVAETIYDTSAQSILPLVVHGPFRIERDERTTMRADVAEGLRFLWRQRLLRTLAVIVGVFNFASNATWAILVLYAVGPASAMGLSEPAYGLLLTTVAAGSLLGSLVAEWVEQRHGQSVLDRRRVLRRGHRQRHLERHHGVTAATGHPRPTARTRQQRLPPRR